MTEMGNVLCTLCHAQPPTNVHQAAETVDSTLAMAMHATRYSTHSTLGISPGALVFHRDMFLVADLLAIRNKRQALIDESLHRANLKHRSFDYKVNQQVLILADDPGKLDARAHGPYRIAQVHRNGTVTPQKTPHLLERINIRRLRSFR